MFASWLIIMSKKYSPGLGTGGTGVPATTRAPSAPARSKNQWSGHERVVGGTRAGGVDLAGDMFNAPRHLPARGKGQAVQHTSSEAIPHISPVVGGASSVEGIEGGGYAPCVGMTHTASTAHNTAHSRRRNIATRG